MGRRWTWTAGQDDHYTVELLDDGIRWECDTYDERAGAPSSRSVVQPCDDFLGYGPVEPAPENIARELAAALGLADPRWLKPLDPRIEAFLKAASVGNVDTLRASLTSGIDVDVCDQRGFTALWNAIVRGRTAAALLLLDAGADVSRHYRNDATALSLATKYGNEALIKRLPAANSP
jgi:hypothetical protein